MPLYKRKQLEARESNKKAARKLLIVLLTSVVFVAVEIAGGVLSHSIAIMSDAAHLASDVMGLGFSVLSLHIALRDANDRFTYGYHRVEVLGALFSLFTIWAMAIMLVYEATLRFYDPPEIMGKIMFGVAILSLVFNVIQIWILHTGEGGHVHNGQKCTLNHDHDDPNHVHGAGCSHSQHKHDHDEHDHSGHDHSSHDHSSHDHSGHDHGHHDHSVHDHGHSHSGHTQLPVHDEEENPIITSGCNGHHGHSEAHQKKRKKKRNLNVEAAYLHILGDMLNSIGVIIASTTIYFFPNLWYVDPLCTYLFAFIVLWTTRLPFWQCILLLLEATPENIDLDEIREVLMRIQGLEDVHNLHVFAMTQEKYILTTHLTIKDTHRSQQQSIMA